MRELVLSLGLTILTSTLLFVYFRNKHNSLNDKVNLVFDTIQEHNDKMQRAAEEEMMRARAFQQRMHEGEMMQGNMQENMESNDESNMNGVEVFNAVSEEGSEEKDLIEVSDDDLNSESEDSSDEEEEEEEEDDKSLEDTKVIDISSLPKMDYTKLTKAELKKLCDEKEINYTKSSNKAKLVELLIGFESDDINTINLSE